MEALRIVLASASPRRRELLEGLGLSPEVRPANLPEIAVPQEPPGDHVRRLAEGKGRRVAAALGGPPALVLAADTEVVLDGETLGKPSDDADALRILRRLRGREHDVLTAVWAGRTDDGREAATVERTRVRFAACPEATLRWYVATGEPRDKAGAYGIQGYGALLIDGIEGSWSNVVGLPVERLPELLLRVGVDVLEVAGRRRRDPGRR